MPWQILGRSAPDSPRRRPHHEGNAATEPQAGPLPTRPDRIWECPPDKDFDFERSRVRRRPARQLLLRRGLGNRPNAGRGRRTARDRARTCLGLRRVHLTPRMGAGGPRCARDTRFDHPALEAGLPPPPRLSGQLGQLEEEIRSIGDLSAGDTYHSPSPCGNGYSNPASEGPHRDWGGWGLVRPFGTRTYGGRRGNRRWRDRQRHHLQKQLLQRQQQHRHQHQHESQQPRASRRAAAAIVVVLWSGAFLIDARYRGVGTDRSIVTCDIPNAPRRPRDALTSPPTAIDAARSPRRRPWDAPYRYTAPGVGCGGRVRQAYRVDRGPFLHAIDPS